MSILEQAAALLQDHTLCDECLGRQFSQLGHGLSNADRGRALRVVLCLQNDATIEYPDLCTLCLNHFLKVDAWAKRALELLAPYEFERYLVGTHVPQFLNEAEEKLRQQHGIVTGEPFKQSFNRAVGKRLGGLIKAQQNRNTNVDFNHPEVTIHVDLTWEKVTHQVNPLYVFGRYRKLLRGIPQTHWPCRQCKGRGCSICQGTGAQYPESVESLIGEPLQRLCEGQSCVLHGAGREDIDARMLGSGRPFIIEIKHPKRRFFEWETVEKQINVAALGKVEVHGLQPVLGSLVGSIKERKAQKRYWMLVRLEKPVDENALQEALHAMLGPIAQRTPQRVAHRRADKVRQRELFDIEGKRVDATTVEVTLTGAGGLYVKELMSGDGGRTTPSLAQNLGVAATVIELDVLDILGEFL